LIDVSTAESPAHIHHHLHAPLRPFEGAFGLVAGLSMTMGGGPRARLAVGLARPDASDRVVDVGCGPGTAVRMAAKTGATVTGVDPSSQMLRFARRLSRNRSNVTFAEGTAESLPLPDRSVTVAWAIASAHHWSDVPAGVAEMGRVLVPGGRLLILERFTQPDARGHAAHGLTESAAEDIVGRLTASGFTGARYEVHSASRHTLVAVLATKRTA
jgi:ubiquinone/menaquinone biosynthesis C-methylase UbiE